MSAMSWVQGKAYRVGEMVNLVLNYAADGETRRKLVSVYAGLSDRSRYDEVVDLNFRIKGSVFPFRMRLSDIFIIGEILHEKQYRLTSSLSDAPVIVDLGANIGVSVIWFLAQFPNAKLYAFEPAKDNLIFLEPNVEALDHVVLESMAVGDVSGNAVLHHGEFGGMHSLQLGGGGEKVPVTSLADYMVQKNINHIDLLKLDIEGGELEALKGLGERIHDVRVIIGEVHETIIDADEFYAFLDEAGFEILWKRNFMESKAQGVHGFEAVYRG